MSLFHHISVAAPQQSLSHLLHTVNTILGLGNREHWSRLIHRLEKLESVSRERKSDLCIVIWKGFCNMSPSHSRSPPICPEQFSSLSTADPGVSSQILQTTRLQTVAQQACRQGRVNVPQKDLSMAFSMLATSLFTADRTEWSDHGLTGWLAGVWLGLTRPTTWVI